MHVIDPLVQPHERRPKMNRDMTGRAMKLSSLNKYIQAIWALSSQISGFGESLYKRDFQKISLLLYNSKIICNVFFICFKGTHTVYFSRDIDRSIRPKYNVKSMEKMFFYRKVVIYDYTQ